MKEYTKPIIEDEEIIIEDIMNSASDIRNISTEDEEDPFIMENQP